MRRISPTASFERALTVWRRAELRREGELVVGKIDGDDLARAGEPCAEHDAQAHAAQAHHRDRLARLDPGGVDDRADAGQHRAAEQGGELERQVGVDLDAGFARHHRMGGEGRDAEQVVDRLGAEREPPLAGEQRSGGVGFRRRLAQRRTSRGARAAAAAARDEHQHDVIAGFKVGHPFADLLDDPGRLMAERHRDGPRPRAVDHREVRMAEARRRDLDQDFAAAGRSEVELHDFERLRVGRRAAGRPGWRRTAAWMRMGSWPRTGDVPMLRPRSRGRTQRGKLRLAACRALRLALRALPRHITPASPLASAERARPGADPCRRPRANSSTISRAS